MSGSRAWSAVVPLKPTDRAKSRLVGFDQAGRAQLSLAMAADTVRAVLDAQCVQRVLVITDDAVARDRLQRLGALVVPDVPAADLNAALDFGFQQARHRDPGAAVVLMTADLPCLRGSDVDHVLSRCRPRVCFVPDIDGTGTTMLMSQPGTSATPRFGPRSRAAHRAAGAVELRDAPRSTRRDVDTPVDLWDATRMGVGPATAQVLGSIGYSV
jgi:2-phospho-L-lactate guanylyltransferase